MNTDTMHAVLEKIKAYDRILLFRHFRPDGDAVGSTKGLQRILQLSFPEKEILLQNSDFSDYLSFLGGEDAPIEDEKYADALGIVLDTATEKRISNQKFSLCKEICKIDHHIEVAPYGDVSWVEELRSSTCEMVAHFYNTFKDQLKIDAQAATYLYTGMVTDSGRFRYRDVSGETLRLAATLLEQGIDTERIYANLYLEAYGYLKFKAHVYQRMQVTEHGVAYLYVDKAMQEEFNLTQEAASASISCLDSIRGCICWMIFVDNGDGSIRVRLRSRFVTVSELAEEYRGGGHACAAGATVYSEEEMQQLLEKADARVWNYKQTHEDWL